MHGPSQCWQIRSILDRLRSVPTSLFIIRLEPNAQINIFHVCSAIVDLIEYFLLGFLKQYSLFYISIMNTV
jgi:hypothetical protein